MSVTLTYPNQTESATKQILITRSILVISPWLIVAVCVLIALVVVWRLYARYQRRSKQRAASMSVVRPRKAA
jgi:flagellar biosynthesis/type III secretory pathway M-ring protein FliF/YscJ